MDNKFKPQLIDNFIEHQIDNEFLHNDKQPILDIDYKYYFNSFFDIIKNNFVLISIFLLLFVFLFYRFKMSKIKKKRDELIRNNKEIELHMNRHKNSNEFDLITTYNTSNNYDYDNILNDIMED